MIEGHNNAPRAPCLECMPADAARLSAAPSSAAGWVGAISSAASNWAMLSAKLPRAMWMVPHCDLLMGRQGLGGAG